ncbi:MAG: COX15/CtaA family protein [Hyphomicrobiales bacterium]
MIAVLSPSTIRNDILAFYYIMTADKMPQIARYKARKTLTGLAGASECNYSPAAMKNVAFHSAKRATSAKARRQRRSGNVVRLWLFGVAALIVMMVVVGGATRLTESGLSITEWRPVTGVIPPLSEDAWEEAFAKYRQIPQYRIINKGMDLGAFKTIYWWEWAHRFLGRVMAIAFFVPFIFFWWTDRLGRGLVLRLTAIFLLGAAQGGLGWFMVASGLANRTSVSQYRLAAHLALAVALFGIVWWIALGIGRKAEKTGPVMSPSARHALALTGLIFVQIVSGAFVAGLDAGMGYNTWPLMDGALVPDGLFIMSPWWANLFENAMTVQFDHRLLAYSVVLMASAHWIAQRYRYGRASGAGYVLAIVLLQAGLGVVALLWQVPVAIGLLHQTGAMILLALALWHCRKILYPVNQRGQVRRAGNFGLAARFESAKADESNGGGNAKLDGHLKADLSAN